MCVATRKQPLDHFCNSMSGILSPCIVSGILTMTFGEEGTEYPADRIMKAVVVRLLVLGMDCDL